MNNEIPVDPGLHDEFESTPLSEMCRRWHLDFKSLAVEYTARFFAEMEA